MNSRACCLVLALSAASCAYHTPSEPSKPLPSLTEPNRIAVDFISGTGDKAGTAKVTARVLNLNGAALTNQVVTFTTDLGTMAPTVTTTDADGFAIAGLTSTATATVTARSGSVSGQALVAIQKPPPAPLPPGTPPPPPPPVVIPPPPAPSPTYSIAVVAAPTSVVAGDNATLTATATPQNGAGAVTSYAWDCDGNGTTDATTSAPTNFHACVYSSAGTIHSKVTVTDGTTVGTGTTDVTVTAAAALTVQIVPSNFTPTVGVADIFTATVTSSGAVPALLQWEWDFDGDGTFELTVPSAASPNSQSHTFGSTGVKTVKVRVTDTATGRTAIGTVQVTAF